MLVFSSSANKKLPSRISRRPRLADMCPEGGDVSLLQRNRSNLDPFSAARTAATTSSPEIYDKILAFYAKSEPRLHLGLLAGELTSLTLPPSSKSLTS